MVVAIAAQACVPPPRPLPPQPSDAAVGCIDTDGYADAMGSGHLFLVDEFGFAELGKCLDRDGDGESDCAINRAWRPLLPVLNNMLVAAVSNGRILMVFEVAGLCAPYDGADPAVTIKIYPATDADPDPTNNLCLEPGCGQVLARAKYMSDGQSLYRAPPQPVIEYRVRTAMGADLAIDLEQASEPMTIKELDMTCLLPEQMDELSEGVLCGVAPVDNLALVRLPVCDYLPAFCQLALIPDDLNLAEYLVVLGQQPDVDMDGDGLEEIELDTNNRTLLCYDGDGSVMGAKDCLHDPAMQDGYSVCFSFHGIPGAIVGIDD